MTALGAAVMVAFAEPLGAVTLTLGDSWSVSAPGPSQVLPQLSSRGDITVTEASLLRSLTQPLALSQPVTSPQPVISQQLVTPLQPVIPLQMPPVAFAPAPPQPFTAVSAAPIPPSVPRQLSYHVPEPAPLSQAQASVPEGQLTWGLGAIALALYCRRRAQSQRSRP